MNYPKWMWALAAMSAFGFLLFVAGMMTEKSDCEARGLHYARVYGVGFSCVEVKP